MAGAKGKSAADVAATRRSDPKESVPLRDVGEIPIVQEDEKQFVYMVLSGCSRFVNSHLEQGRAIERGETVRTTPLMGRRLLQQQQPDPDSRKGEMIPYFRVATDQEVEDYRRVFESTDPDTMTESQLAKLAREEALAAGEAHPDTAERAQVEKNRQARDMALPARRQRRK